MYFIELCSKLYNFLIKYLILNFRKELLFKQIYFDGAARRL